MRWKQREYMRRKKQAQYTKREKNASNIHIFICIYAYRLYLANTRLTVRIQNLSRVFLVVKKSKILTNSTAYYLLRCISVYFISSFFCVTVLNHQQSKTHRTRKKNSFSHCKIQNKYFYHLFASYIRLSQHGVSLLSFVA